MKLSAFALLSGGLDSSLAAALAREQGYSLKGAVTFNYGQRAASREIGAAQRLCERWGIPHTVLSLPWFANFSRGGALLSQKALPNPALSDLDDRSAAEASAKAVWVPNRNGVFLEIAAGLAEDAGAQAVIVGFNREEAVTFADNSVEYRKALTEALRFSTSTGVKVISPTETLSKPEIVEQALNLDFPLELLWSCYEAFTKMCGRCESCMRLKRALKPHGRLSEFFIDPNLA